MTTLQIISVLRYRGLSATAIELYLILRCSAGADGRVALTTTDYKDFTGLAARSYAIYIKELLEASLISRIDKSSYYVHEVPPLSSDDIVQIIAGKAAKFRNVVLCLLCKVCGE